MERRELLIRRGMNIAEGKDVIDAVFLVGIEPAFGNGRTRVLIGTEEDVPERNVRVVVGVMIPLVMYTVRFRSLKKRPQPAGCSDIPVVE